jgi:predicted ester cyclase
VSVPLITSEDHNKAIVRRFFEIVNSGELKQLDQVLDKNVIWHGTGGIGTLTGMEDYKRAARPVIEAFPDSKTVIDLIIAEGDLVAARYTASATQKLAFMGFQPTGKRVVISGNSLIRIEKERIVEVWHGADLMGLLIANTSAESRMPDSERC